MLSRKQFFLPIPLLALILGACTSIDDYARPEVPLPTQWSIEPEGKSDGVLDDLWWKQFNDPVLNIYIDLALSNNQDVRIAASRVEEYLGRVEQGASELYPSLELDIDIQRSRNSENTMESDFETGGKTRNLYSPGLLVGWELDLWGRLAAENEAARAELLAKEEVKRGVMMTLVNTVAKNYIDILHLDRQLEIVQDTLYLRKASVELFQKQYKGGKISELELAQVLNEAMTLTIKIPLLKKAIAEKENFLSFLVGMDSRKVKRGSSIVSIGKPKIPQGMPSSLLSNRPDVREAEQNLIAGHMSLQAVKTRYYPSISLTGLWGFSSFDLSTLFTGSSSVWSIGSNIIGTIFDAGGIDAEVEQGESIKKRLIGQYIKTVEIAFREVNDVLASYKYYHELLELQKEQLRVSKDYAYYANKRYESGLARYLEVLDGERSFYLAQLGQAQTQRDILVSLINAYKVMGGKWADKIELEMENDVLEKK